MIDDQWCPPLGGVVWLLQALELLETLGGRGLQPNVLSYNLIIMGCGRCAGGWTASLE